MWQLNLLLLIQVLFGIVIVILLHKVGKMKVQVDEIIREVKDYISFIIEDEAKEEADITRERKVIQDPKSNKDSKNIGDTNDSQSSLIQSVLGEFFP